jgi:hypothetical protein
MTRVTPNRVDLGAGVAHVVAVGVDADVVVVVVDVRGHHFDLA